MEKKVLRLLCAFFFLSASYSYGEEISITSDFLETKDGVYSAKGSVVLQRGDAVIRADAATYNPETSEVFAEGGIVYEDPEVAIECERALIDMEHETGVLYDVEMLIKEDNFHVSAPEIRKTGKDRYVLKRASFTTCEGPNPDWCFRAGDVDIIIGERLKARHASMRIRGIPVLYTPFLWAPIITERKTGFLLPVFGFRDSTGFYYRQPFFWAIAENQDFTFYLDVYPRRALGEGVEYRYLHRRLEGSFNFYHLGDGELDTDFYEIRGAHRLALGRFSGFLDINSINRKDFYRLYEPYLEPSSKRFLESRAELSAAIGRSGSRAYLAGRYFIDLKEDAPRAQTLQRLPETGLFIAPKKLGPLASTGRVAITNFHRESGASGQRVDAGLGVSNVFGKSPAFFQTATLTESLYGLDDGRSFGRTVADYSANLQGRLMRSGGVLRHAAEGTASYRYVAVYEDETPPLFDKTELASDMSGIGLTLLNRFMDRKSEFASLRLAGGYDFLNEERPFSPLAIDAFVLRPLNLRGSVTYNPYENQTETEVYEAAVTVSAVTATGGRTYTRSADATLYTFGLGYKGRRAGLEGRIMYDPDAGGEDLREIFGMASYVSQCWSLAVSAVKRPEDYSVFLAFGLTGLGSMQPLSSAGAAPPVGQ